MNRSIYYSTIIKKTVKFELNENYMYVYTITIKFLTLNCYNLVKKRIILTVLRSKDIFIRQN